MLVYRRFFSCWISDWLYHAKPQEILSSGKGFGLKLWSPQNGEFNSEA